MRREDGDLVTACLQANRSVNHQPLSASNTQVRVEEDDTLLLCHC